MFKPGEFVEVKWAIDEPWALVGLDEIAISPRYLEQQS